MVLPEIAVFRIVPEYLEILEQLIGVRPIFSDPPAGCQFSFKSDIYTQLSCEAVKGVDRGRLAEPQGPVEIKKDCGYPRRVNHSRMISDTRGNADDQRKSFK